MNLEHSAIAVSVGLFFGMLAALDMGYRLGERSAKAHTAIADSALAHEGIGAIEAAVFALLGLLLAFSLDGAMSRLDVRRQLVIDEATSIRAAYDRIDVLPESDQPELRRMFREYLDARLSAYQKFPDRAAAEAGMKVAEQIEKQIWARAVAVSRSNPNRDVGLLLLPAINQMEHVTTERKIALHVHLPWLVFVLLISVALLSGVLAGFAMAKRQRRSWLHLVFYAFVVAITIFILMNLEYPRAGHVQLDAVDRALLELRESIR